MQVLILNKKNGTVDLMDDAEQASLWLWGKNAKVYDVFVKVDLPEMEVGAVKDKIQSVVDCMSKGVS